VNKHSFEVLDEYVEHVDELLMFLDYLLESDQLRHVVRSDYEALVGVRESIVAELHLQPQALLRKWYCKGD
jgi:hypothetical protein